ncbi:unnamed protein product, partial [Discosporangium mesarthrocarpum]
REVYQLCQSYNAEVIAQVGTVADAREAVQLGASCVVAQGREAGGHGLRPELGMGTLSLAAAVVVELSSTGVPVLAAGGIASGRCVLSVLALGCSGAALGTRYLATDEALTRAEYKEKVVDSS